MQTAQPRVIPVRHGTVSPEGSWLYVWLDTSDGSIAYVGATGFDPELRAFLHLTSDSPELGRVKATVPRFNERDFDVLAFELPFDCARPAAKQALVDRLSDLGLIEPPSGDRPDPMPALIEPIVDSLRAYIAQSRRGLIGA